MGSPGLVRLPGFSDAEGRSDIHQSKVIQLACRIEAKIELVGTMGRVAARSFLHGAV